MNPLGKTLATIMAQPSTPLNFLNAKPRHPMTSQDCNPKQPTYLRLLARVRLAVAPPAKGGTAEGVREIALEPGKMKYLNMVDLSATISLPPKQACQHTRRTRSSRCFHCGEVME